MPTESSAVFRFIDRAQRQGNAIRETSQDEEPLAFGSAPGAPAGKPRKSRRAERTEAVRLGSRGRMSLIAAGAIAVALISGAVGIYVGRTTDPVGAVEPAAAPPSSAPLAPAIAAPAPMPTASEPAPVAPVKVSASLPAAAPVASATVVTADAGFDLRVNPPGAKVSLDGQPIGAAPLRVRNLTSGRHSIDIEAPTGFFGKHVEVELSPGEAPSLGYELEPVKDARDGAATRTAARADEDDDGEPPPARDKPARVARESAGKPAAARAAKADNTDKASRADEAEPAVAAADEAAGGEGTLMLGSKPPCEILIDGKKTGLTTPQTSIELPAGTHAVVLVNRELGIKKKVKVRIAPDQTTRVVQDLTDQLDGS